VIKIHSYCSYKHSPSGFVYGSFLVGEKADNSDYCPSEENNANIVQTAFENGIIRRLCGKIPDSYRYIFLVRKLKYNYGNDHSDIGREVQMNFGFEFDSFDEFLSFVCGFINAEEQDAQTLYHQLADCVIPDESVKTYKYRISKKTLDLWIASIKQPLSNNENEQYKKYKKGIYITASSTSTDYTEEISSLFEFPNTINEQPVELCREKNTANYYYPLKKKSQFSKKWTQVRIKPIIVVALILIGLLAFALWKNSSKKQTNLSNKMTIPIEKTMMVDDQQIVFIKHEVMLS
jgi:hypothetical protein